MVIGMKFKDMLAVRNAGVSNRYDFISARQHDNILSSRNER